jgi:hypothetical protein
MKKQIFLLSSILFWLTSFSQTPELKPAQMKNINSNQIVLTLDKNKPGEAPSFVASSYEMSKSDGIIVRVAIYKTVRQLFQQLAGEGPWELKMVNEATGGEFSFAREQGDTQAKLSMDWMTFKGTSNSAGTYKCMLGGVLIGTGYSIR